MKARRLRTLTLWTGTLLCVLIAAAFVVSAFWQIGLQFGRTACCYIAGGSVTVVRGKLLPTSFVIERHTAGLYRWDEMATDWTFSVQLPLFTLLAAAAVPTLLVLRFVPKFPRGCCRRCGYNLKGLTEARCPECGAEFEEFTA